MIELISWSKWFCSVSRNSTEVDCPPTRKHLALSANICDPSLEGYCKTLVCRQPGMLGVVVGRGNPCNAQDSPLHNQEFPSPEMLTRWEILIWTDKKKLKTPHHILNSICLQLDSGRADSMFGWYLHWPLKTFTSKPLERPAFQISKYETITSRSSWEGQVGMPAVCLCLSWQLFFLFVFIQCPFLDHLSNVSYLW